MIKRKEGDEAVSNWWKMSEKTMTEEEDEMMNAKDNLIRMMIRYVTGGKRQK